MSGDVFAPFLKRVAGGEALNSDEAARAFGAIMRGEVSEPAIAALLTALAVRKPTVDEIVGAALAMRLAMTPVDSVASAIDLCGTGGDGLGTLNISTACAFVVSGAGLPVAKHGNRNMSSKSGAADVVEALGAKIDLGAREAAACLRATGVCFLFAQTFHPAMKYAAPVRRALGFRTILNLLGPLSNPAGVTRQLVGVFAEEWIEPLALALHRLGAERAWVVHGEDGLDEITTTGTTSIAVLDEGVVRRHKISPEDAGLPRARIADLAGGTARENAEAIRRLLGGETGPFRDIVLLNSAAALCVGGKAADLRTGVALSASAIDSGRANTVLNSFVAATREAT